MIFYIELETWEKIEIIDSLKDDKLKVDCLMNPNIELDSSNKSSIISSIKEKQLIVDCLTNVNIGLGSFEKAQVVLSKVHIWILHIF